MMHRLRGVRSSTSRQSDYPVWRRNRPCCIALLIATLFSSQATAAPSSPEDLADLALEDLLQVEVSSASRFSQSIEEAPASVTVLGEDELRERGYGTLAEALVTAPGVYSSNDQSYTYLGVRGFNRPGDYGTRILLLTDGARRNDPLFDQALLGNEAPIEIDWVKRLEFVPGPASAIYGSNALFGTANAVMLSGGDINGARVSVDAGSERSRRISLVAGNRLEGDRDWFLGFASFKSDGGDYYYPEFNNGTTNGRARGLDGESYQKAYAKFRWGNWRLTGNFSLRNKDAPNAPFETNFGQPGTQASDEHRLVELRYDGEAGNVWQPSFRVFSGAYRYDAEWKYSPAASDSRDRASADWFGGEYHLAYTGIPKHKLIFGVDAQWNTRVEQRYYETSPRNVVLDTNDPSHRTSFFVQDEWRFHPEWLLNVGLRNDRHSDYSAITSPRAALVWQATPRLSLRAIAGSAYRVPNAYERFYNDGDVTQSANPDIRPEHIRSVELAAAYRFGQNGRIGISAYSNRMRDLIDQTTDSSGVATYTNHEPVRSRGVEISAENVWQRGYRLRGSVAWQQSRAEDGSALVDSPRMMGKLIFSAPIIYGWQMSGEVLGLSSRQGVNGPVPGYGIVNLSLLSSPVSRMGQLRLTIRNVGDRRFFDPAASTLIQRAIEQEGRQVFLRWTLSI